MQKKHYYQTAQMHFMHIIDYLTGPLLHCSSVFG